MLFYPPYDGIIIFWKFKFLAESSSERKINFIILASFFPLVSYFGFKWLGGIDITKAYPHIDSREKFVFFNDKASGKDDIGAVFEYHYDDGTKQVVFKK